MKKSIPPFWIKVTDPTEIHTLPLFGDQYRVFKDCETGDYQVIRGPDDAHVHLGVVSKLERYVAGSIYLVVLQDCIENHDDARYAVVDLLDELGFSD